MKKKKKIFPAIHKNLKNFLTDESGKITKKEALLLSVPMIAAIELEGAAAAHTSSMSSLGSGVWTKNVSCQAGGIVGTPTLYSHNSHASHGSHGSCGGGHW